jgi:hypothetical protein
VTDERHRPGIVFAVEVCRIGGMREVQLKWWFTSKTVSTRRQRLHGWRLWQACCMENEILPEGMKGFSNPGMEVAYFIQEALTAVKELFEVVAPWALLFLKESIMVRQAIQAATTGLVRGAKYRDIWDLTVVMEFVRKGPPSEELPLKQLKGRTAFLFMVLLPCRLVGMWKMDVSTEKRAEDGQSVEVPTKERTHHGREETVLVIRCCKVANWCPLTLQAAEGAVGSERGTEHVVVHGAREAVQAGSGHFTGVEGPPGGGRLTQERASVLGATRSHHLLAASGIPGGGGEHTHHLHLDGNWAGRRIVEEALKGVGTDKRPAARTGRETRGSGER